ncbi:MAG: TetR/AcrR family transcriptional regulator [Lachnospiraceae bacterium]|nr:TetR/AcrR family transcriptional regulator [Lachnospiraceae bacterium]
MTEYTPTGKKEELPRQDRTKYKLADSIKACMKTTPVDKITVKDIVEGCGLTRQTFYRNFKDKYDLINWYFDKLVLQSFEQIGMGNTVGETLTQKFDFIRSEKAFFTEAFRSDDYNSVKEHDFELILQFYKNLIARKTSRPLGEELDFLLEMYCRGSVYMTEKWVLGGMKDSSRRLSDTLVDAMPPKLAKVFGELGLL